MTRPARLADHVRARVNEARIERQWAALERAGLPGPAAGGRSRGRALLFASGAAAVIACGALLWLNARHDAGSALGAMVESAQAPVSVQLEDGSRVELSPQSRLGLVKNAEREIRLELRAGRARFAVTHDRARPFRVAAGQVEVRVVGTRFELGRTREPQGERLEVAVSEGVVEVRRTGESEVRTLRAGERWSALVNGDALDKFTGRDAPAAEPGPEPEPEAAAAEEAELDPSEAEAERATEPAGGERGSASRERAAARLFERANLARRAGRMHEAAEAYAELLEQFPRDLRVGLSAFELGRIRMDALSDPAGAIRAFERALGAGNAASFHEDALARIVVAYDAQGRREACRQARERYLERYPRGVHAHVLAMRCK